MLTGFKAIFTPKTSVHVFHLMDSCLKYGLKVQTNNNILKIKSKILSSCHQNSNPLAISTLYPLSEIKGKPKATLYLRHEIRIV